MKTILKIFAISILSVFIMTGSLLAAYLDDYDNITIYDETGTGTGWYGGPHEDQEVEPGAAIGQQWDLEGFFKSGSELVMVGGYDFDKRHGRDSGDIFIDVTGDVIYGSDNEQLPGGNGIKNIENVFGYDYVLDMDFRHMTYDVYSLPIRIVHTAPLAFCLPDLRIFSRPSV